MSPPEVYTFLTHQTILQNRMLPPIFFNPVALGLQAFSGLASGQTHPPYSFTALEIDKASKTLVPGDSIHVSWTLSSDPGYDSCYIAIRSATSPDTIVAEINPHPQCGASSANLVIPRTAINSTALYNGSPYVVRINTPHGTYGDSAIFQ
jgi:hypothetical protein